MYIMSSWGDLPRRAPRPTFPHDAVRGQNVDRRCTSIVRPRMMGPLTGARHRGGPIRCAACEMPGMSIPPGSGCVAPSLRRELVVVFAPARRRSWAPVPLPQLAGPSLGRGLTVRRDHAEFRHRMAPCATPPRAETRPTPPGAPVAPPTVVGGPSNSRLSAPCSPMISPTARISRTLCQGARRLRVMPA